MKVNNLPNNYTNYTYVVANWVDGEYWYYGCWNDRHTANEVALEIGGATLETSMVERGWM